MFVLSGVLSESISENIPNVDHSFMAYRKVGLEQESRSATRDRSSEANVKFQNNKQTIIVPFG